MDARNEQFMDDGGGEWVRLRREDFQQLVQHSEELEGLVSIDGAPACDEPPCSGDEVMMDIDLAG
jgi:hypothetical protein